MRTWIPWTLVLAACAAEKDGALTSTGEGELTMEQFAEAFADRFCDELVACGGAPCEGGTGTTTGTGTATCDFDPVEAQACLDGEWTCSDEVSGFSFPVPPEACASVCGGATTETTGTTN